MKLFIDPQFWVSVSFLLCMGILAKVMCRRFLAYIDQHMQHRRQLLSTLAEEEKNCRILLKQEKQRSLSVKEERKLIKQKLKEETSALRTSMQNQTKHNLKLFEQQYKKLCQGMVEEFETHLQATLVQNILEGTRTAMRQPAMRKHQSKIVARHLKTLQ